ncbi:MAG: chemotaxis protein CheW [Rickettsiales bacterium]
MQTESAAKLEETITDSSAESAATVQFLTFTLGKEEYGVDIMMVREVKGWSETTRLPNTPDYIRGVLNLRGIIIPIFDLRARFGGGLTEATEKNVVIILAVGERTIGILADTVSDILTVPTGDIKTSPDTNATDIDDKFVNGLIAVEERMVVLLDISILLANDMDKIGEQDA